MEFEIFCFEIFIAEAQRRRELFGCRLLAHSDAEFCGVGFVAADVNLAAYKALVSAKIFRWCRLVILSLVDKHSTCLRAIVTASIVFEECSHRASHRSDGQPRHIAVESAVQELRD